MTDFVATAIARLTGPGGEFEVGEEDVRGVRMPVFVNRKRSLTDFLAASVGLDDREYLVCGEQRVTYAQHASAVASLSRVLAERYSVGKGDRVAILGANSPNWVVAFWAVASLGAITSAFNAWWTRPEVAYGIEHSSPRVLFVDEKRAPLIGDVDIPVVSLETDLPRLAGEYPTAPLPTVDTDEDEPAAILYTSGTTGRPKGALHSVRNMCAVIDYHRLNDAIAAALGAPPQIPRRYLMSMPLFHIGSLHNLVLPRLATGDTVVMNRGGFEVDRVLRLVERERITNWAIVPTMAHRIVEHGDLDRYDLSSLTALSVNSAPSSPALKERLRRAVPAVKDALADSYGLTESSTAATVASAAVLADDPTTVGPPIVTVGIEIRDAEGRQLPDGVEGEICLRSQFTMLGYWNDVAATAAVFAPDGWLRTGDIGCLRNGRLYLSTRRSDLILRGGENVYPAEVEAVLDDCPGVAESAVYGVEHPDLGQEVAAIVVADDEALGVDALRAFVGERLAYYKVPTQWQITTTPLPRTATGKVIRRQLGPTAH